MRKQMIVDVNAYQTRVALLEEGSLAEIYVEQVGRERIVGNIYKGRVQNVLPGMQAAFVDIGLEKNAFLYAGDILVDKADLEFPNQKERPEIQANIKDIVKPGQEILLQILKEPFGTKGARVTTHITLPGRTLVLMPTVNYIGVSRRIEDEEERSRLRSIIERIKPENMGIIVRTAAYGKSEEEFISDISFLVRMWEKVIHRAQLVNAPRMVHAEESLVFRTIRDIFTPDVEELMINDRDYYEKVKVVADIISPEFADRVKLYQGEQDLFDRYELESKIDKLLQRKVWLKNGGYIIIDQTEALTAIDVNTGKYVGSDDLQQTLFETNCEAAREIARQLRLRDIGGIIIIDFIDMEDQANKDTLIELLRNELKKDRTKSNVVGMTGLGLVEMTRKKVRKSLSATMQNSCPYCGGESRILSAETVAHKIRRQLRREQQNTNVPSYLIEAHPHVASFIEARSHGDPPFLPHVEGRSVYVRSNSALHFEEYSIQPITDHRLLETIASDSRVFC
jgi:ribonuclease G